METQIRCFIAFTNLSAAVNAMPQLPEMTKGRGEPGPAKRVGNIADVND